MHAVARMLLAPLLQNDKSLVNRIYKLGPTAPYSVIHFVILHRLCTNNVSIVDGNREPGLLQECNELKFRCKLKINANYLLFNII